MTMDTYDEILRALSSNRRRTRRNREVNRTPESIGRSALPAAGAELGMAGNARADNLVVQGQHGLQVLGPSCFDRRGTRFHQQAGVLHPLALILGAALNHQEV